MRKFAWLVALLVPLLCEPAAAQQFNQAIVFGDSNVDSGWFVNAIAIPLNPARSAAIAAAGAKPTTNPGPMNSEVLAAYFGLAAIPANQPGGTNYATSGAKSFATNVATGTGFPGAIPTVTQFANYLAATGGRANPDALYLINSGANDVGFASLGTFVAGPWGATPAAFLQNSVAALAQGIATLQAAGARYIVVPDQPYSFGTAGDQANRLLFSTSLWSGLAASGVNFIPADINAVRLAIAADRASFGFQFIGTGSPACTQPPGVTTAWALQCSPANLVAPNAMQTHLFADDQHLTTAGQKIFADYYYSLIVAPSLISMLAENSVKTRARLTSNIQTQLDTSQRQSGASPFTTWVTGDIGSLAIDNYPGFPDDPSLPLSLVGGVTYRVAPGVVLGGAISVGHNTPTFSNGFGKFSEDEIAGSVYAALRSGPLWGNVVGTYGALSFDVARTVPIGITVQSNTGSTHGDNASLALQTGYDLRDGALTHGPVVGALLQWVRVGSFTETGSFTSLGFGDQARDSAVLQLGWRASYDLGMVRPFAQATWNHEFDSGTRFVSATLTTIAAPSYTMPGVRVGQDWGTGIVGAAVDIAQGVVAIGSFTGEFSQRGVASYGGQIGVNVAF